MPENEQVISVGEREYLKHLHSMQVSMDAQTAAMERIAMTLELLLERSVNGLL